jgi:3-oxoacyl-(acyl-carrier-protein) synthase
MNERRVVITGMGVVTPVGSDLVTFWDNLKNGVSGIKPVDAFDASAYDCRIAGQVRDFDPKEYFANRKMCGGRTVLRSSQSPPPRWRRSIAGSTWRKPISSASARSSAAALAA